MASVTQRFSRNEPYFPASRDRLSRNLAAILRERRMTPAVLAAQAGIDEAIVRALVRGEITRPSLTTLDALSAALHVDVCELLADGLRGDVRGFDRRTNPVVAEVAADHPQLFKDWSPADYDDLYSRFGVGGPLSAEGTLACAQAINDRRALALKVAVLLETEHGAALAQTVDRLYSSAVL
ncbi:MAG: helix-turn-helix transcriptional regulator [Planctomycetales bacterium]|nr:helix-turn-helix transcriptional regulator [Planctomycetales bacterium]MBN8625010.1 helix-turn-helix transcriptional regulator [Planctomycetota bacterium]